MKTPRQVMIFCNAVDETTRDARGIVHDSPAATRKVVAIARALIAAGIDARIVSMGRGRASRSGLWHAPFAASIAGVPIRYGPMLHVPLLSELVSMLWLVAVAAGRISRAPSAVHLFYNQLTAYLPALAVLRLGRRRTAVDIEDGPIDNASLRAQVRGNASPRLFAALISDGALLACTALEGGTAVRPTLPCYGAIDDRPPRPRASSEMVTAIFTGTLAAETGADLLADAIALLRRGDAPNLKRLVIEASGFGPSADRLAQLAREPGAPWLVFHGRLDHIAYAEMLARAQVGLSLKLASGPYAQTTYPSKTIEYAENALALVTTDISDVRAIFGDAARYLPDDEPTSLAQVLTSLTPSDVARLGTAANDRIRSRLSLHTVGQSLRAFFFAGRFHDER